MTFDFLIVGGGIGGAVLAHLLGRRGCRVLVLEKARTPAPQNRPEILWPATVAVLRDLLPPALEARWALPLRGGLVTCGRQVLVQFGPEVLQAAGVQPYSTAHTRELLLEHAPCEHRSGVEVVGVLHEGGRVVGVRFRDTADGHEQEHLAGWVIADDGPHSAVRTGCGVAMRLVRFPLDLLGFGFDWPTSLPPDAARIWINQRRVRSGVPGMPAAPLPGGKGAALLPVRPDVLEHPQRLQEELRAFATQDSVLQELLGPRTDPAGFTHFRLAWCRAPRFGVPGALLMGDAAHPVTPAGGQGANLSVADALAIADAVGGRPEDVLAAYAQRRRGAAVRSLGLSRGAARVFSLPRPVLDLGLAVLPWAARRLNARPGVFGRFLRIAAGAFRDDPPGR